MSIWKLERGANLLPDGRTRFSVWAPHAGTVSVRVRPEGGGWTEHRLDAKEGGLFEAVVPGAPAGSDYVYRLNGEADRPDPVSRHQPVGVHGPSRVVDPAAHRWTDDGWNGIDRRDLLIYELHVGTFTNEGTFRTVRDRFPHLSELGVTAIEIMPVAEFPGRRNWGYDGVHLYAPESGYGGPEGLRELVEAAHEAELGVILDVVYNHLGPEGNYLRDFGPYFTDRYGTPWGAAINFDDRDSDEVRRYFIDNARYWVTEFHIDGLRLDAVHAIFDFGAYHILEELSDAVHAQADALGRRVHVIAESDLNDPRVVRPKERGGYGLDAQWNDDFHHAVHAALTGERSGYYVDFGGLDPVARAYRDRFVLAGRRSRYRRRRHGAPATDVPRDRFVVFIQNHDQVGNRARGDRLSTLITFEEQKIAAAALLLSPYVPLLFMGEEYGETSPFLYFVDHTDAELLEAVRKGRQREFEGFEWGESIPDPGSEETFEASRLRPEISQEPPHSHLLRLYRDLIRLRRSEPLLRPGTADVRVDSMPQAGWIALGLRGGDDHELVAAFNFTGGPVSMRARTGSGRWTRLLSTDDERYGGAGPAVPERAESGADGLELALPTTLAAVYRREAV